MIPYRIAFLNRSFLYRMMQTRNTFHGFGLGNVVFSTLFFIHMLLLHIFSFCMIYLNVFGVGVSCRKLYYFVVYLYVNGSGSITSVGEERANLSAVVYL